jgi:hypothetical protein
MVMMMIAAVTAVAAAALGRRCLIIAAIGRSSAATAGGGRFWLDNSRHAGGICLPADVLGVGELVVLLVLHAPVLEPDLDLSLGEAERMRDFYPSSTRQIAVEVKLLEIYAV